MTIVEAGRPVTGGVDTHLDTHVAAALDPIGGLLGVKEFRVDAAGYRELVGWLQTFGPVGLVGVEGTGSNGAGLARHLRAAGVAVAEVDRPNRQLRRRQGKSDPIDAVEAARAAQSGRALGAAKHRERQRRGNPSPGRRPAQRPGGAGQGTQPDPPPVLHRP
jgi:transposase